MAEVYPVSSSAQVTLLPRLLGWDPPADRTRFAAGLHAGSALGVALALRPTPGEVRRSLAASVPAALAGLALQDVVEHRLGTTRGIAAGLALGAAALLWADSRASTTQLVDTGDASPRPGTVMGLVKARDGAALAQVAALAPGVSRHGAVLATLRARGVDRPEAARTSLVMSLPITLGAASLTAVRGRALPPVGPALAAAATAYAATRRARWTRGAVIGSVAVRLGVAAAAVVHDRRNR